LRSTSSCSLLLALLLVAGSTGCLRRTSFHCEVDSDCASLGNGTGACEPTGYCSFADADCDSGARYDRSAGDHAGTCVGDVSDPDAAVPDGGLPTALHDVCLEGQPMPRGEDACVDEVCADHPACCDVAWDDECARQAGRCDGVSCAGLAAFTSDTGLRVLRLADRELAATVLTGEPVHAAAWGDYDLDGLPDLAIVRLGGFDIYHAQSWDGAELELDALGVAALPDTDIPDFHGRHVAWADYDRDGDLDLAVGGTTLRLVDNQGDGTFAAGPVVFDDPTPESVPELLHFEWADLDGDADLDLVAGFLHEPPRMYRNYVDEAGERGFTAISDWTGPIGPEGIEGVDLCDLEGDGDLDLVLAGSAVLGVYLNDGGTIASEREAIPIDDFTAGEVVCTDLDGDDLPDLVTMSRGETARVHHNAGGTIETPAAWIDAEGDLRTWSMAVVDLTGDGLLDLVTTRFIGAYIEWHGVADGLSFDREDAIDFQEGTENHGLDVTAVPGR
jgi:hypothetical protein